MRPLVLHSTLTRSCSRTSGSRAQFFHEWSRRNQRQIFRYFLRHSSTLPNTAFFRALCTHDPASYSVIHSKSGRRFSYGNLVRDVTRAKDDLERNSDGRHYLPGRCIAFLAENSYEYVGKFFCPIHFKPFCAHTSRFDDSHATFHTLG